MPSFLKFSAIKQIIFWDKQKHMIAGLIVWLARMQNVHGIRKARNNEPGLANVTWEGSFDDTTIKLWTKK